MRRNFIGAWSILDEAWPEVESMLQADPTGSFDFLADFVIERPSAYVDDNGIGHVHLQGVLLHNSTEFDRALGNTDYKVFSAELRAMTKAAPEGVVIECDSPGGMVMGCPEAAEEVARASFETKVVAYSEGLCASACYHVASAADAIVCAPSAMVGSIGAKMAWLNAEGFREKMGIKLEEMVSEGADLKGGGDNPDAKQRQHMQDTLNAMADRFQAFVSEHREVDPLVYAAGCYEGEQAKALGLVDEVMTREQMLAEYFGE